MRRSTPPQQRVLETLRHELKPFGIRVAMVEPGFIRTALFETPRARAMPEYAPWRDRALRTTGQLAEKAPGPRVVAEVVARLLASRDPPLRNRITREASVFPFLRWLLPASAFEAGTRRSFNLDREGSWPRPKGRSTPRLSRREPTRDGAAAIRIAAGCAVRGPDPDGRRSHREVPVESTTHFDDVEWIVRTDTVGVRVNTLGTGQATPWHFHSTVADDVFCLEAPIEIGLRAPDETVTLAPGQRQHIPAGRVHRIVNRAGTAVRYLLVQAGRYDFNPEA